MAAIVIKKCYFSNNSKITLFDFSSSSCGSIISTSNLRLVTTNASQQASTLRWSNVPVTTSSTFITAMDENIAYDQLPVMSPMMASNSNESGNGGQSMMDDGKIIYFLLVKWRKSIGIGALLKMMSPYWALYYYQFLLESR